jgi:CO/xanthine dehydrogenase FAD-binding subunit
MVAVGDCIGVQTDLTHLLPTTLQEALDARAAHPGATVVAGGTGVMLVRNRDAGERAPLLDLSGVGELTLVSGDGDVVVLGARTTYTTVIETLAGPLPDLAAAARTVASRQVRNRGTLAGALVLADPSSDALAVLGAAGARVELAGPAGRREIDAIDFVRGPGDCALAADELVCALRVPVAGGPVAYAKAGARNAMARAVCAVAVRLGPATREVAVCVVGAGPRAVRPVGAQELAAAGDWDAPLDAGRLARFGELIADALPGIGDARGSRAYRRHAASVLARRALARAWSELPAWS